MARIRINKSGSGENVSPPTGFGSATLDETLNTSVVNPRFVDPDQLDPDPDPRLHDDPDPCSQNDPDQSRTESVEASTKKKKRTKL